MSFLAFAFSYKYRLMRKPVFLDPDFLFFKNMMAFSIPLHPLVFLTPSLSTLN